MIANEKKEGLRPHSPDKREIPADNSVGQRAQELQLAEYIIENSTAIIFRRLAAKKPELRKMVYVSANISRFGYRAEDFMSGRIMFRDIVYPGDSDRTLREIQSFVKKNIDTYTQTYRIVTSTGDVRWVEDRTSVVEDVLSGIRYHQGIVIDIHRRKEAEEKLRKSEEKYRRIVETTGEGFLLMDESMKIVDCNSAYARMVGLTREELIGEFPFNNNTGQLQALWLADDVGKSTRGYDEFELEITASAGRSVPVLIHANTLRSDSDSIIGIMAFVTDMSEQKKALFLAGEVQRSLLPATAPCVSGLDIAGRNTPCDEVGGDYYDYLWNGEKGQDPFTAVVGDISGHGVDSALLMSSARGFLRMRASQPGTSSDIINAMNQHLTEDVYATGRFMTLFYLTINHSRDGLEWVRAGHDPVLLYDPNQKCFEELKGSGLALGVDRNYSYQRNYKDGLKTGQVIVIGTDGIWEACNSDGEMFGKARFKAIIRRHAGESAETILNHVFHEHAAFCRGLLPEDDITLVVIKLI
ncbi:MAG: SpoIIE family protein phosphatase [Desulfobacterales bacterium]|nr:SpoIIE family protein phosphatase [Desulfobacterales bacterium]